jgi:hypothetical protein
MPRWQQRVLLRLLDRYRLALRAEGKQHAEDAVIDVMDMVVGWCSPHLRLSNFIGGRRGVDSQ